MNNTHTNRHLLGTVKIKEMELGELLICRLARRLDQQDSRSTGIPYSTLSSERQASSQDR